MAASLPFPGMRPLETSSYHALRPRASFGQTFLNAISQRFVGSAERRDDLASEKFELTHDVAMRHARKERPADQMSHGVRLDEPPDLRHALLGTADDEAILHQLVEIGRDGGIDERMPPAARVLFAIGDHDVPLGQLARLR